MFHLILLALTVAAPATAPTSRPIRLADSGKSLYPIVVSAKATDAEQHDAEELAHFLREISGAPFQVKTVAASQAPGAPAILVGRDAAATIVARDELATLGQEGYILRTRGTQLAIVGGRPRGTLYGVYSLLEDYLGCRWFTPDVSRIPKRTTIELPALDRRFVPVLEYRSTDYPNSRDADWAVRNKINGNQTRLDAQRGGKVIYGPFVHTFNSILNPKDHFAAHPEYFSEVNGKRIGGRTQLCLTNPDVQRIAIDKVRQWMRSQPRATIFSVSQNDWHNYCTCKNCQKVIDAEGAPSGLYLRFVNKIADAIKDEFPHNAISTLAYQFTRKPPKITKPRPNVIVRLCDIECCFAHPLTVRADLDPRNAAFAEDLRRWHQISNRLYIWDYVINYAHAIMPFPNLYSLKPNINFFMDNGVKGIYEEADYFTKGGEFAELRTWIIAKTLWDPTYDTDRAIDEFLDGYYGAAAPALRRYIDLLHGKSKMDEVHFRIFDSPASPLFAEDVVQRAEALMTEAEKAVSDDAPLRHRVQVAHLPIQYVEITKLLRKLRDPAARTPTALATTKRLVGEFDAVAKKEGVTRISEGRSYADWLASVKKKLETE